jgi:sigma-B regulation protein RsbU (phosphoserine phosphatase)
VADVSGKGVSSALLASFLQGALQEAPESGDGIVAMLDRVNRYMYQRTEGEKYATVFYSVIQSQGSAGARMTWTNAGHCAPVVLRAGGGKERLDPTSMPVGILDITPFAIQETWLLPGDRLVIFSDGLTEAQDSGGREFAGEIDRLLSAWSGESASEIHERIRKSLKAFAGGKLQADDQTLLVIEISPG